MNNLREHYVEIALAFEIIDVRLVAAEQGESSSSRDTFELAPGVSFAHSSAHVAVSGASVHSARLWSSACLPLVRMHTVPSLPWILPVKICCPSLG